MNLLGFDKQKQLIIYSQYQYLLSMASGSKTIRLTAVHRVAMLTMILLQFILFLWGIALLLNYCVYKVPFLEFESMTTVTSTETHYLRNCCLYALFWVQHIVMAALKYKMSLHSFIPQIVLYERYIFNITSGLTLWYSFSHTLPSDHQLFALPSWFSLIFALYGFSMLAISMKELGVKIFMPFKIGQILNNQQLTYESYDAQQSDLKIDGIYAYLRHPMQAGFLSVIFFAHTVYTVDKLLFSLIMGGGILLGIYYQEKRMAVQFSNFKEYTQKVKYRFLPFI